MSLMKWRSWRVTACASLSGTVLALTCFLLSFTFEFLPTNLLLQDHKELHEEWKRQAYVDITLEKESDGCPQHYEILYQRPWNGTYDLCFQNSDN